MRKLPVTVAIPVRNEEGNLSACLTRLGRFARVVVLDSGSTDRTAELAADAGVEVLQFRWDSRFPKKRNWFLRNHAPSTEWVLFLDADELVDDAFCDELERVLPTTPHVGLWLNYTSWFLGRQLRHGDANRKLALFRVGAGEYERVPDDGWSSLDMEVHEHPVLDGTLGEVFARIDHRDYRGFDHWIRKHNEYSTWEARRILALRQAPAGANGALRGRQLRKYRAIGRWWLPAAYFLSFYVLKRGFLDGYPGLVFALGKSIYFWQIGVKCKELKDSSRGSAP
jgi:glycosyltransferase involved in cell wall biosynthesis